ncbi:MAG: hypothetical protein ACI9GC_000885 [Phycisphaerales bacterium]
MIVQLSSVESLMNIPSAFEPVLDTPMDESNDISPAPRSSSTSVTRVYLCDVLSGRTVIFPSVSIPHVLRIV